MRINIKFLYRETVEIHSVVMGFQQSYSMAVVIPPRQTWTCSRKKQ